MKIDHTALYVFDLEGAKNFFVTYFGAKVSPVYHNSKAGFRSYFLTFDGGTRLELMTRPGLCPEYDVPYASGYAHIALSVGDQSTVDALTKRLEQDGYTVHSSPRFTGDGYYESCINGFEGNLIEITV